MAVRGEGQWTPTETISGALGFYDTVVAFGAAADLSDLAVGEPMLVGDEFMRVDAIDDTLKQVTVARGCSDSIPTAHVSGTRAWFYEALFGSDGRDYATAEAVDVKILTATPSDRLELGDVTADTITIGGRQGRPYPPGNLKVNTDPFGTLDAAYPGEVALTWTHRDRVIQDDRLVEHGAASIGPEAGTTYTIRIYDGVTLLRTTTGVTADNWTYTTAMISSDGEPTAAAWTFEVEAVRSSLVSWQKYRFDVPRRASVASTPAAGSLAFTGFAPAAVPSNESLTVGVGSLVFTGRAPTVNT
jgi:hypothetical protein